MSAENTGNADSIIGVQEAERKARLIVEDAVRRRDARIAAAEARARKIADEAELEAGTLSEGIIRKAEEGMKELRRKRLAEARKAADKVRRTCIGKREAERLADGTAKGMV